MGDAMVRTHRSGDGPGGTIVVEVLGPLEAATVGALRSVVLDAVETYRPRVLTVDLRRVPFMDSIGIGTLVAIDNKAREVGGTMEVSSPSPFVHRLLQITGLTELFGLPDLPEDAPVSGAPADLGRPQKS
ncbi:STAS domain-containing protein [Dactylosporangium sp. NPDC000555]|uniref:STAS domain-containing protein n=1 Tax=Dactylosporangium sp. NPDC000555 TaxID=3154260 RepID=UPI00332BC355